MEKKKVVEVGVVCIIFLILAWYIEHTDRQLEDGSRIARANPGEGSTSVKLTLNAEDVLEDYTYSLEVQEMGITKEQADAYFAQAHQEIDESFFAEGETAEHVTRNVQMKENYVGHVVRAEWSLDQYRVMDVDGSVIEESVTEDGTLVQATAELFCGDFRESYSFGFIVYPRVRSHQEKMLLSIQQEIQREQAKTGDAYLTLPNELDGYHLDWEETREHLVFKVLLFEIAILVLLHLARQERERQSEKLRKEEMMLDYAEVVNKLLILLGSGMSLKQAWNSISARYSDKREKKEILPRHIYEEMLITSHQISDGESERRAYQKFGERTGVGAYYRLVRILEQNLQTGSRGLCQLLEQEAESALEERRTLARKLGEEAGTRMLLPLMLMLGIVIAIIMVPAMLSFNA